MLTLATHIIWTTYGTWPPGDDRGHWSPLFDMYGHLLATGHKFNLPDKSTKTHATALMKEPPKFLSENDQSITANVINKILNGIPVGNFTPGKPGAISIPHALAIEPNHVHLLIGPLSENLDATVGRLKGVSSSLILAQPQPIPRTRTWTSHFWHVFLFDNDALHTVNNYILDHNRRAKKPAHPYPFTQPLPI